MQVCNLWFCGVMLCGVRWLGVCDVIYACDVCTHCNGLLCDVNDVVTYCVVM